METGRSERATRVLVCDDEPGIVELLRVSLEFQGFEVATADCGTAAVDVARTFSPDVVVLDVMMPGMDGFDTLARLRADGSHAPVLFLTAKDAVADRVRGLTEGGDDYVTKPFSLEEVIARIRVLARRGASAACCAPAVRRRTARIRAMTSSRLNGLVT